MTAHCIHTLLVIPALRLSGEHHKFQASVGCIVNLVSKINPGGGGARL